MIETFKIVRAEYIFEAFEEEFVDEFVGSEPMADWTPLAGAFVLVSPAEFAEALRVTWDFVYGEDSDKEFPDLNRFLEGFENLGSDDGAYVAVSD